MSFSKRLVKYAKENFSEVMHTTLDPDGPGVVRIHLIPPEITEEGVSSSVAILNGQDIIPVNVSWTVLLSEFIKEVNRFEGRSVSESDMDVIMKGTLKGVRKVFPLLPMKIVKNDIYRIMNALSQIARGKTPDEEVGYLNIGEYAEFMKAPHRMDLLVSAMAKDGKWNCNLRCIHCYAAGQKLAEGEELDTASWKKIIDNCRKANIPQITFTGGEPTMRSDLVELIDYSRWFVTRLNTNGVRLTKELAESLREASLDSLQITLYSSNEDEHNRLVGAKHFKDTVSGIENALEAGLSVSVNTPLCSLNKNYVETLSFLHGKGVRYVTCSGLIITGNATKDDSSMLQLTKDEIKKILEDAVKFAYENDMEISFTSPGWIEKEFFTKLGINAPTCGACLSNMAVTPNGKVVPCQSWLDDEPLGDMLSDPWEKIWNSQGAVMRRSYSSKMEGECPFRTNCR